MTSLWSPRCTASTPWHCSALPSTPVVGCAPRPRLALSSQRCVPLRPCDDRSLSSPPTKDSHERRQRLGVAGHVANRGNCVDRRPVGVVVAGQPGAGGGFGGGYGLPGVRAGGRIWWGGGRRATGGLPSPPAPPRHRGWSPTWLPIRDDERMCGSTWSPDSRC